MASPFPGMNPYLEGKELWPEVHHWLITLLAGALVAELRPKYRVAIEVPIDEAVREGSLEVREVATGLVVTMIELMSPTNQRSGDRYETYQTKRNSILDSEVNLVEIDLLRLEKTINSSQIDSSEHNYQILVSRAKRRPSADLYRFGLQEPIVDLQLILHRVYDQAGLDMAIDYGLAPPPPKLSDEELGWVRSFVEGV
jgi:Protein of unknown function (DUF4058)